MLAVNVLDQRSDGHRSLHRVFHLVETMEGQGVIRGYSIALHRVYSSRKSVGTDYIVYCTLCCSDIHIYSALVAGWDVDLPSGYPNQIPSNNAAFAATRIPEERLVDGNTFQAYSIPRRSARLQGRSTSLYQKKSVMGAPNDDRVLRPPR